ncbi:MAG TPA: hypothetical protein VL978_11395 [Puia sp.]|nr:hypothetical protein [Puia sp.]
MKNNLLKLAGGSTIIVLALAAAIPARAQKVIEKHFNLSGSGFVAMNFQISDSIRIVTWKKNEVYVRSTIDVNDNKNNDDYKETFNETNNSIDIVAKLDFHCNGYRSHKRPADSSNRSADSSNRSGETSSNDCCCCCNCESYIYHEIYIPENTDFSVETINGNIVISGNTAEIRAKSISGYIDLTMAPDKAAAVRMQTISGTMYSNFDFGGISGRSRQVGGRTLDAQINGSGGKAVDLETISGDIFFRKQGS